MELVVRAGCMTVLLCVSALGAQVFPLTNKVWSYEQEGNMDNTGWQTPGFLDGDWYLGLGLFGFDSNPQIEPLIQTLLVPPSNPAPGLAAPRTYYFRTWFEYVHGDFTIPVLTFSNRVDDGAVFYLNGHEVHRIRMDDGAVTYTNLANQQPPNTGDATEWDVFRLCNPNLRWAPEVNWLAVEVHQYSPGSGDIVFGCELHLEYVGLPRVQPQQETFFECDSITIGLLFGSSPAASYQWFKDGIPIHPGTNPTATNATLVVTNARLPDAGQYFVVMNFECGSFTSDMAIMTMSPDVHSPTIISAMAGSTLTEIKLVLSEPLLQPANLASAIITNVCGGLPLEIFQVQELNPTNLVLITSARAPEQAYRLFLEADQIHDACAGNPNGPILLPVSGASPQLSIARSNGATTVAWAGCGTLQYSTNLIDWTNVPGNPASPYAVTGPASVQFYRLQAP